MTSTANNRLVPYAALNEEEQKLILQAWSAGESAYVPYSYFPVGVAILAENETGQSQIISGGNIQNKSWDVDCCAERSVVFSAFEQGFCKFKAICMVTLKNTGATPCGLCRQVLLELAPHARLISVQNKNNDVQVWQVSELLPEANVRNVVPAKELSGVDKELVDRAIEKAKFSASPYSKIANGAALLARSSAGSEKIFEGVRIENSVYGGTVSAARVAAYNAVSAGHGEILTIAVYADGPQEAISTSKSGSYEGQFANIGGACLQTLRQFGDDIKIMNISICKTLIGFSTITLLLPGSFGPKAVV